MVTLSFFSCKKYNDDSFFSTYTVEKRLINTSKNMWSLQNYTAPSTSEKSIKENNFNLTFSKDNVVISSLNNEYAEEIGWTFDSNKKFIILKNGFRLEILRLEVDKLKLKNEEGGTYTFKKKINQEFLSIADESIFNVPLFGLSSSKSTMKLTDVNHCETNNMSIKINGSVSNSVVITGLMGSGLGYTNQNTLNSIVYSFSKFFAKPGELSFYYKKNAFTYYNLTIKINNIATTFSETGYVETGTNTGWGLIKVSVPFAGNLSFSFQSVKSGTNSAINVIDEIKFWEY